MCFYTACAKEYNDVCFLLGNSPASEFHMPTFRNTLSVPFSGKSMKTEQTECSETSAYKIQTPGNYPEENIQHTEHGESLKSRMIIIIIIRKTYNKCSQQSRQRRRNFSAFLQNDKLT
jgi:hypothetical protein